MTDDVSCDAAGLRLNRIAPSAVLLFAILLALPRSAAAGGLTFGTDEDSGANDGPIFFGFVLDAGGSPVAGARVTAAPREGGAVVATSNTMGIYKFPGFAKEINPDTVAISCGKDGYTQTNVLRRSPPGDSVDPIEIDCTLQKQ